MTKNYRYWSSTRRFLKRNSFVEDGEDLHHWLNFPTLAFSSSGVIEVFDSYEQLTTCTKAAFDNEYYSDLIVIDIQGLKYRALFAEKVKTIGRFYENFFNPRILVTLTFEKEVQKISLQELQDSVFKAFQEWHGWSSRADFDQLKRNVRNARTVDDLLETLRSK